MPTRWHKTQYTGVRYREHPSRRIRGNPDRYFAIRYKINGKSKEEALGWASAGWNAQKASLQRAELRKAQTTGKGPQTLGERRELDAKRREEEAAEQERLKKDSYTFSKYFNKRYFPEAKNNKKPRSYDREESLFRLWIKPVIGHMPFKDIRPFHMEALKKKMADAEKAPRSIQYALAVVRQVFNHAIRNEIFSGESPTRKVQKPKVDNRRMRFLTHDEASVLLKELAGRSKQLHDMALLSLHCGLRAGEIFNLTWGCVNTDTRTLLLMDAKSTRNRTVHMTSTVTDIFSNMQRGEPDELVFKDVNGGKIKETSNAFTRAVKKLGFNEGITDRRHKIIFHTLRHTFASWLVQNGVNLYTVKELLGHSTLAMTERYSHLADGNLKDAVRKLEKSLETQTESNEVTFAQR